MVSFHYFENSVFLYILLKLYWLQLKNSGLVVNNLLTPKFNCNKIEDWERNTKVRRELRVITMASSVTVFSLQIARVYHDKS